MNVTVKTLIDDIDALYDNTYTNPQKLKWINDLMTKIYAEVIEDYEVAYQPLVKNQTQYTYPSGVTIDDIVRFYVGRLDYDKISNAHNNERGYWNNNGKINIFPIPYTDDTEYEADSGELTFTTSEIKGGSFTGFSVGDIVTISGCTDQTANNITDIITGVDSDTLTFADDTFTAQVEEAGDVTIQVQSIKIVHRYKPTKFLLADIETDKLPLPEQFRDLYEYYIYSQIALFDREFGEHGNYARLFNSRLADLMTWWGDNKPLQENTEIESRLNGYETYSNFDKC